MSEHPEPLRHQAWVALHAAGLCLSISSAATLLLYDAPLASMVRGQLLAPLERARLLATLLALWLCTLVVLTAMAWRHAGPPRRQSLTEVLATLLRHLWPLSLLGVLVWALDPAVWATAPITLFVVSAIGVTYCAAVAVPPGPWLELAGRLLSRRWVAGTLLGSAIAGYCGFVSLHTILHHYSLGTGAYDLGIRENVIWSSIHGRLFESAMEVEGNHLGVHTAFIYLLVMPIYALFPRAETLLIIQACAVGLAAWPLYRLARLTLGGRPAALAVAAIYLAHPAIAGACFYDFHELAFAPALLFAVALFSLRGRRWPFWVSLLLLLAVKEDMSLVVVLVGAVIFLEGTRGPGMALVAIGGAAYAVLQHVVIPHFVSAAHSFAWYYTDVIPPEEGPAGLLTTVLLNPLLVLRVAATEPKMLFLLQVFAPLAFLCFASLPGVLLTSYGLASALLASRPALYEIGFQYSFALLPPAFIGLLLGLRRWPARSRARGVTVALLLTLLTCYHYGMIHPRQGFKGGFRTITFDYSQEDRARYREVVELARLIPPDASVTANEELVPHIARRRKVETLRYAAVRPGRHYEYFFLLRNQDFEQSQQLRQMPEVAELRAYEVIREGRYCVLLKRKPVVG